MVVGQIYQEDQKQFKEMRKGYSNSGLFLFITPSRTVRNKIITPYVARALQKKKKGGLRLPSEGCFFNPCGNM